MSYTGVTGQLVGELTIATEKKIEANVNVTPTTSQQVITPSEGYDAMAQVTVEAVSGGADTLDTMMNDSTRSTQSLTMTDDNPTHTCYGLPGLQLTLPNTITSIYASAFSGIGGFLKSISAPGVITIGDYAFDNTNGVSSVNFPVATSIGICAFEGLNGMTSYNFPAVTSISGSAFDYNNEMTNLYLGYDGVVSVPNDSAIFSRAGTSYGAITVHVPEGQLSAYQSDANWSYQIAQALEGGVTITFVGDYA